MKATPDQSGKRTVSGKIIFASGRTGDYDIWSLDLQSNDLLQLTTGHDWNDMPRWSPDGLRVAFISHRTGVPEIWLMNEFGGDQIQLTHTGRFQSEPSWYPDGKKLVYCSNGEDPDEVEVWSLEVNEPDAARQLFASPGMESSPSISPDGARVLFSSPRAGNMDIWEFEIATGEFRQLTNHLAKDLAPSYSPDGNWIAFVSNRSADGRGEKSDNDIWLMSSDALTEPRRLTTNAGPDKHVSWSPCGRYLIYCAGQKPSTGRLQMIDLDESKIFKLDYDRSELETELGIEVKNYGVFTSLIPNFLQRKFASSDYYGSERHPHWTK